MTIPPLSSETTPARFEEVAGPSLTDLRAAVDALKKPRSEHINEPSGEPASNTAEATSNAAGTTEATPAADESIDPARR